MQRKNYATAINEIYLKLPKELKVQSLEVDKGEVILTVSGDSLLKINDFIDGMIALKDNSKNKILKNIIIQSLSFQPTKGLYTLAIKTDML